MSHIELELRGECTETFDDLKRTLDALAKPRREVRTMVMFFGEVSGGGVDVRCRVTNGKGEVVVKVGDYHAHDRLEASVDVSVDQVVQFARLFALIGFTTQGGARVNKKSSKVGTRESWEYHIDGIDVSLVRGMSGLAYIEFERRVTEQQVEEEKTRLEALSAKLNVDLWTTGEQFYAFCNRLTTDEDWEFTGSEEDVARLAKQ